MSAVPSATAAVAGPEASLEARLARFPAQQTALASQRAVSFREAGRTHRDGLPLVLLHGIGSGAASWLHQFEALGKTRRVTAWDAPGYGASTPLAPASPRAADYAAVLNDWLDVLQIERCVLLGHSLGAIVAGAFAAAHPQRVAGLLLLSPASGYGAASADVRDAKRDQRLAMLNELGPQGLADKRSARMLSPHAGDEARAWVRWNMARVMAQGYAQATHLLAYADLAADLARIAEHFKDRVEITVGAADVITPPSACEPLALAAGTILQRVPGAGHAGYIEAPTAYTAIIDTFCRRCDGPWSHE